MNCQNCGKQLPEQSHICPNCGAHRAQETPAPLRRGSVILIVALLALFCVGIAALYYSVLSGIGANSAALSEPGTAVAEPDQTEHSEGEASETVSLSPESGTSDPNPDSPAQTAEVQLTLSTDELHLSPGTQTGLSVSVQASGGAEAGYVYWSSSDETVASIDSAGLVTAVGEGECVLTASSGAVSASCRVTVRAAAGSTDFLLPTNTVVLTADDLKGMTQDEVMLARNEIFARHGRVFKTASIQAYFDACAWYVPDPDFDENVPGALSAIEQANLRLLIEYETERGWR